MITEANNGTSKGGMCVPKMKNVVSVVGVHLGPIVAYSVLPAIFYNAKIYTK